MFPAQHVEENTKSRKIREAQENSEKAEAEKVESENEEGGEGEAGEGKASTEPASSPASPRSSAAPAPPTSAPEPEEEWPRFFTIPILSGLMVTSILLGILGFAIGAMMEIKPMMRFDDPKGKSLQFAVQD